MITAILKPDSPLRAAFPEGVIPLAKVNTVDAILGDEKAPQNVWLLDVRLCSLTQIAVMAQMMAEAGQGTREEIIEHLTSGQHVPVRTHHVSSVMVDGRAFL